MFRTIDPTISVSPQISTDLVADAVAKGIRLIINNRPEGEEPGQVTGDAIAAAAAAAGIAYRAIPITHAGFSINQVDAMIAAMASSNGPVLAYCRSGTRSTYLWALSRAKLGDAPDMLYEKAANAGYDLSAIRRCLMH